MPREAASVSLSVRLNKPLKVCRALLLAQVGHFAAGAAAEVLRFLSYTKPLLQTLVLCVLNRRSPKGRLFLPLQ